MINLLPPQAKRTLALEHRARVVSVLMLAASVACLVALVLSVPVSILLARQTDSLASGGELAKEMGEERRRVEEELSKSRLLIDHLTKPVRTRSYSEIVSALDSLAGPEVAIAQFTFDARDKLIITGVAATRADLSAFKDRMEQRSDFKTVDLPLSSLVRDTDLPFSITITLH